MQKIERLTQVSENVIFDSSSQNNNIEPMEILKPQSIMDMPGTPHEKLQKLAEMV